MDGSRNQNNTLRSIHSQGSKASRMAQFSSKDRRYIQQVEKALASFDSMEEWADYIAFLSRLQKALQLSDDPRLHHTVVWIPHEAEVANKLSLCLSSRLPNGVHQKALSIYNSIFYAITKIEFEKTLNIWLPGILPVLSSSSIQVKPQLISIYRNHILNNISKKTLQVASKPIILSLLPGLDDETSEVFGDILDLLDTFKVKLGNDSNFWQSMFLCIIENPEKRLGALYWCNKRLPVFKSLEVNGSHEFSDEARACLTPESGLLIRLFATSINTETSFNSANDIIIIRGFFDLLSNHLPLNSFVLSDIISSKDKELLLMACSKVTLKKDMSLNRRLWNWLLGPEPDSSQSHGMKSPRSNYFESNGLDTIASGLFKMAQLGSAEDIVEAFKISTALTQDRWEISHLITPVIFSPLLKICFEHRDNTRAVNSAQVFFDGVEAKYIWRDINAIILEDGDENLDFLEFILKTFNFSDTEIIEHHIPLAILCLFVGRNFSTKTAGIFEILVTLIPYHLFSGVESSPLSSIPSKEELKDQVDTYYSDQNEGEQTQFGYSIITALLSALKSRYIQNIKDTKYSSKLGTLFCEFLSFVPRDNLDPKWYEDIIGIMLQQKIPSQMDSDEVKQTGLLTSLTFVKILNSMSKSITALDKSKILRVILSNIWTSLGSTYSSNYQVESVKAIFELGISTPPDQLEAGILSLLSQSPSYVRTGAFQILWTHTNSFSEGDIVLRRPLVLLLDDLHDQESQNYATACGFVNNVVLNGSANRLLKILSSFLLSFDFLNAEQKLLKARHDVGQFAYYMEIIRDVTRTNPKLFREAFSNEFVVIDDEAKFNLVQSNDWDISTYKSLIISVISLFFRLEPSKEFLDEKLNLDNYYNAVNSCLGMLSNLITGNEADFPEKFFFLVETCFKYTGLPEELRFYEIELIESKLVKTVFNFLRKLEDLKAHVNLLHIDDENKEPLLVRLIIKGVEGSNSTVLLQSVVELLTRALYLFNESVFSVLLLINDALVKRVFSLFEIIKMKKKTPGLLDVEGAINVLLTGLEDLLSVSHSFLVNSNMRQLLDKPGPNQSDPGFLGNVIQGVFQIESPAVRNTEQNKLYSVLLSLRDGVKTAYEIWNWADSKPSPDPEDEYVAERSLHHLSSKLRFRTKKLLGSLIDIERQEVIETLIVISKSPDSSIKLLNLLDGGRSQVTLPHILTSIVNNNDSEVLEVGRKAAFNAPIPIEELSLFLSLYFNSIDTDSITDIWTALSNFLKEVVSHTQRFKKILPDVLMTVKSLSLKLNVTKINDQKKKKRESSEIFMKLLSAALNEDYSESNLEKQEDSVAELQYSKNGSSKFNDSLLNKLPSILENLHSILQDGERISNAVNLILAKLVSTHIKSKSVNEISLTTLSLVKLVGQYHPIRSWRSIIYDCFTDDSFFFGSPTANDLWKEIITTWIETDKERVDSIMNKVNPTPLSSASNLFNWSEGSEVELKIFSLRRIAYLIMVMPKDFFLSNLDELLDKIESSQNIKTPSAYRAEIFTLIRVISLQFSEIHLMPRWTVISHDLVGVFEELYQKSQKELSGLNNNELKVVLSAFKLLDELLLLGYDDFNFNEWLFVTSNPNVARGDTKDTLYAIIDKISAEKPLTNLRDTPIKVNAPSGPLSPLLYGVKSIESISSLRLLFDSLSLINYERVYGLYQVDIKSCKEDIFNDLLT